MKDVENKISYRVYRKNGTYSIRGLQLPGEQMWRNILNTDRPSSPKLIQLVADITAHPMYPYIRVARLAGYMYVTPSTTNLAVRVRMKIEALEAILNSLNTMEQGLLK